MTSIVERIANERAGGIERAKQDYPAWLLRAFTDPQEGDTERVQEVCSLLRIDLAQFEKHAKIAEGVPKLLQHIESAKAARIELKELVDKRQKLVTPDRRESPAAYKRFADKQRQHVRVQAKHAATCRRADHAAEQLKELRERHWWGDEIIRLAEQEPAAK